MARQRGAGSATNNFPREVGARLRLLRLAIGLPAGRLAAEIGVLPPRWSQWEHGRHPPDIRAMVRLCRRYRVTLDYIYLGDESGLPRRLLDAIHDVFRN
jgi:transcriptional regulator with XRE-family HTH domain